MDTIKGKITWTDVSRPTDKELQIIGKKFHLHPVILQELQQPSARAHVEAYDRYLFVVYHFPSYNPLERVSERNEVDLLITKNEVVTIHYRDLEGLNDFRKSLSNPDFKNRVLSDSFTFIYEFIETFLNFNQRQLRHIQEKVDLISSELFKDREKEILKQISYLKRDLSEYRIIVRPGEQLLQSLSDRGILFWGEKSRVYLNDLAGDYLKLLNQLEDYRQAVSDFEDTNNQLINVKNNEVTKTFTILAFLTFPLMLFAALFSMNTRDTPIIDWPGAFWIIFGVMVLAMVGMFAYFRKRDWL